MATVSAAPVFRRVWPLWAAAAVCALAAGFVLVRAGLPDASAYAGQEIEGLRFAAIPGERAPLFDSTTADGEDFTLLALRGRPVVLNFWATWCAPCAVEMPELQRVQDAYGDAVTVAGVNTGEGPDAIRGWAEARGLRFPLVLDEAGQIAAQYQLRGQPTTFILDANGIVTEIIYGPATFDGLAQSLESLLARDAA
jgi:peroxiredoxin